MSDFNNTAALWKRQPRENDVAGKQYPQYEGNITVNDTKMNLAAWLNTNKTKEGQPDISLRISEIKPKTENQL